MKRRFTVTIRHADIKPGDVILISTMSFGTQTFEYLLVQNLQRPNVWRMKDLATGKVSYRSKPKYARRGGVWVEPYRADISTSDHKRQLAKFIFGDED